MTIPNCGVDQPAFVLVAIYICLSDAGKNRLDNYVLYLSSTET